jgi:hypothetical protein
MVFPASFDMPNGKKHIVCTGRCVIPQFVPVEKGQCDIDLLVKIENILFRV